MKDAPMVGKWVWVLAVVGLLLLLSYVVSGILSIFVDTSTSGGNVALIPLEGIIMVGGSSNPFGESIVSSTKIVDFIKSADKNPNIMAIIVEINSPGGSGVASDEIATALKNVNKTKVAYIREVGASGGYMVASAADYIFVNKMSVTGSIGVLSSYLQFSGLLHDFNITYERLVAGKYKDIGSPYKQLTDEERLILEEQLATANEVFVETVARNRGLAIPAVKKLATGEPIIGLRAKDLGLVDAIGGKDEAVKYVEQRLGIVADVVEYREHLTFADLLSRMMSNNFYSMGLGIGKSLNVQDQYPVVWT